MNEELKRKNEEMIVRLHGEKEINIPKADMETTLKLILDEYTKILNEGYEVEIVDFLNHVAIKEIQPKKIFELYAKVFKEVKEINSQRSNCKAIKGYYSWEVDRGSYE